MIPPNSLPAIVDAQEEIERDEALPLELIEGLLHVGSRGVLGGGSKTNKTWVLICQGIAVATGHPWLGRKTTKAKVLYVNLEIQAQFFARRVKEVSKAMGVTLEKGSLSVLNLRGHVAAYDTLIPRIVAHASGKGYQLIILDPIYKILGNAVENDATDVTKMLNAVDRLSTDLGAAVFFAAHFTKGNQAEKYAIDRISGSGVFGRDPDAIMTLTRHETDHCYTVDMTLRNHAPKESFVVQWEYPLMRPTHGLDPKALHKVSTRGVTYGFSDLLDYLPKDGLTTSKWEAEVRERLGCSRSTFLRNVRKLEKTGNIVKENDLWKPFIANS